MIDYALEDGRPSPFPVIRCRNVYMLPGVPHLLQQKWKVGPRACLGVHLLVCAAKVRDVAARHAGPQGAWNPGTQEMQGHHQEAERVGIRAVRGWRAVAAEVLRVFLELPMAQCDAGRCARGRR